MMPALTVVLGVAALVILALVLRRRQREAEEHAARTLTRLRRRHTALTDRLAGIGLEVAALSRKRPPTPPAHP